MIGPLYHWAPADRRDSIRQHGLLTMQPPTVSTEPQSVVSLSPSPSAAWEVSGAMPWVDVKAWDLWEVRLDLVSVMLNVHADGGLVLQVFCDQPIPPESLFWCGGRDGQ